MPKNIGVQDIDASLTYGQLFSGKNWKSVIIFVYISIGIAVAFIIMWLIGVPLTKGNYDSNDIAFIICCLMFIFLFALLAVSLQISFNKGKKKAKIWLEDAVILEAQAMSLGQTLHVRNMIAKTATAIQVNFEYDGKRYKKQSLYKDKPLYLAVYTKYANSSILIAYSPKYDEVMLIKPESAKRIRESNSNN